MFKKLVGRLVLVASLVLAGFVYYLKYPDFRAWVDTNAPVVKQVTGPVVAQWDEHFSPAPAPAPVAETPAKISAAATPEAAPQPAATPLATVAEATPQPRSDTVDLAQLSQSRNEWPKLVSLKKIVEFPAVMDGKVVGSIKAPAGTQAQLVVIQGNKAGVEYQGGGAMVDIVDTDLIEQVQSSRHLGSR